MAKKRDKRKNGKHYYSKHKSLHNVTVCLQYGDEFIPADEFNFDYKLYIKRQAEDDVFTDSQ